MLLYLPQPSNILVNLEILIQLCLLCLLLSFSPPTVASAQFLQNILAILYQILFLLSFIVEIFDKLMIKIIKSSHRHVISILYTFLRKIKELLIFCLLLPIKNVLQESLHYMLNWLIILKMKTLLQEYLGFHRILKWEYLFVGLLVYKLDKEIGDFSIFQENRHKDYQPSTLITLIIFWIRWLILFLLKSIAKGYKSV